MRDPRCQSAGSSYGAQVLLGMALQSDSRTASSKSGRSRSREESARSLTLATSHVNKNQHRAQVAHAMYPVPGNRAQKNVGGCKRSKTLDESSEEQRLGNGAVRTSTIRSLHTLVVVGNSLLRTNKVIDDVISALRSNRQAALGLFCPKPKTPPPGCWAKGLYRICKVKAVYCLS